MPDNSTVADAANSAREDARLKDAERQAAILENELKALKARFGDAPASGISGQVKVESGAGDMETALLAHAALGPIADQIAAAAAPADGAAKHVIIYPGVIADLKELSAFLAFVTAANAAFAASLRAVNDIGGREAVAGLAGVGVGLDALSRAMSYFRSDVTVRGTQTAIDDMAFARQLAGKLRATRPQLDITIAGLHQPVLPGAVFQRFVDTYLGPLFQLRQQAAVRLAQAAPAVSADAAATPPPAATRLAAVTQSFDAAMESLGASDSLGVLARQYAIAEQWNAADTVLLQVKVDKAGGASYDHRNLWTLFGVMPYKLMGAAIVSYALIDSQSGRLLRSDVLTSHGGFHRPNAIARLFQR